ncbi:Bug family tripartite tricarboxylate transporter substrate binding protein [Bordetella bronchiseptica]|uniref:Bug family tripartite tricarboxylate transporter substrate binding protein n=1 Tax=Bordetella bronchiseptica TaxID=518 RepID=UPI00028B947C|nr:tripartite tricarboxylate transporter substrate binding protein [Bordetella bronchiseptica]AUL15652.1 hypothetical protein BTL45_12485 [Bordetella bronchiseptica]AWP58753.1 hypothetical protein B7P02_12425 [Bordetella bronchiseptica]KAK50074.1 tripartite tricarboxylate transporter family receptor [Bordetella bronchiseptica OSU054]KAK75868.1 tripartite tricarboxylate transporter family receptor [Bordetella bronchiseptica MO211]KAK78064.1 tripartite tricarboxylate transporter family receptor 
MSDRRLARYAGTLACFLALATPTPQAAAQPRAWPAEPITLVVPYAPGGTTDRLAREYADYLREHLKQPVLVQNRPGASTNIGSDYVVKSKPDGYTFLVGIDGLATNQATGPVPPFDPAKDLAPISLLTRVPCLVAAGPKFKGGDAAELIKLARTDPEKYSISSASLILQVGMLNRGSEMRLSHIPYKGGAQAAADAMGGQVDLVIANVPVLASFVRSGKLRALAVTSGKRSDAFPDTPTMLESGMSKSDFSNWYGVFGPKGTPPEVVERMAALSRDFVRDPVINKRLSDEGYQLESSTPQALAELIVRDAHSASEFVKANPGLFKQ